jgi:hypothetical protein
MMSHQSKPTYRYWRQAYVRMVTLKYLTHCPKSQGAVAAGSSAVSGILHLIFIEKQTTTINV